MLMALGIALHLMFGLPGFVRQPRNGYATAVAPSSRGIPWERVAEDEVLRRLHTVAKAG
jgi:hypothetical protein